MKVDSLLITDADFKKKWKDIKAVEAINLFSTEEVVDFFVTYFENFSE